MWIGRQARAFSKQHRHKRGTFPSSVLFQKRHQCSVGGTIKRLSFSDVLPAYVAFPVRVQGKVA